jgi:hypothetical protein
MCAFGEAANSKNGARPGLLPQKTKQAYAMRELTEAVLIFRSKAQWG